MDINTTTEEKAERLLNGMPTNGHGGDDTMTVDDELLTLMVSCLCGGIKICVQSHQQALEAQRLGAVGVIFENSNGNKATALPHESLSIPCYKSLDDAFTIVQSEKDVKDLVHPKLVSPILVTSSQCLLAAVKDCLGASSFIPVFCAANNVEEAENALSNKFDGILLMNMPPKNEDMQRLLKVQCSIHGSAQLPDTLSFKKKRSAIGVVSLQGDYLLHEGRLREALRHFAVEDQFEVVRIRTPDDIKHYQNNDCLRAIVLPGGWSNLQTQLFRRNKLDEALTEFANSSRDKKCYILCVCAGWILARSRDGYGCEDRLLLNFFDTVIDNNILHGRYKIRLEPHTHSEEYTLFTDEEKASSNDDRWGIFSNAPVARNFPKETTEILARVVMPKSDERDGAVVGIRQGNFFGYAFHDGIHRPFVKTLITDT
mmetsp:Transcript_21279/g.31557  ORF Transcript_21279/g.31557 Transcript_21279/m.31557 type:complete len:428 (-) Transcript_21279:276-1559(-)